MTQRLARRLGAFFVMLALSAAAGPTAVQVQLDAPAPPDDPASAFFTLADLYERLLSGAPGTKRTFGFVEPTSGPVATGPTLDDLMLAAPSRDDALGATPEQVLLGRRYWSLRTGAWGPRVGAMPNVGAQVVVPGTGDLQILPGYHDGTGFVQGDLDLVPGNIRANVELFGVAGDPNVVDTTSGDAAAADIALGRTAWVDGMEVTGTAVPSLRFVDNGDGTVTDNRTGLVWLRDATCADLAGTNASGQAGLIAARTAASALASGTCGLTDGSVAGHWRLPHIGQLWSLVDTRFRSPAVQNAAGTGQWTSGNAFVGIETSLYWSTTEAYCTDINQACALPVGFSFGNVAAPQTIGGLFYVWPVKDCTGQFLPAPASCP